MEKKNTKHSDDNKDALTHEERYIDFAKQLAKTFNFSTSLLWLLVEKGVLTIQPHPSSFSLINLNKNKCNVI